MRNEYDFSNAVKNPYTRKKTAVTIRLDDEAIAYFKQLAIETDLPYQTLINSFLTDCAKNHRKPDLTWQ
ncbi:MULTISPECIES: BrnA antitoxin family protein [Pasteurellaceae]|uniref:BrnA antitoxin family protein n=1 Tax=Pasteurella atlantica TaxID=2827233 RepID=A0AAW8CKI2_9PAST|nr:BrnA antitoxin family protein [Pasteurella atlantica]MBR0573351.1 BrnA antitoxin family protein [Pasteurella atlantica]MDP8040467.1 BrnA antitoxin family protein [Pasteurella atlantica]MDP8041858.1 BrnA antitoxin family protein [Pasteurella atlantica]MDP8043925.1 BrnA antitoxin family protein [Pasteurella atlantica]MDP8046796.1 BrnA antitoxin family protein [Pasteurella atlantica]